MPVSPALLEKLDAFFARPIAQEGTGPLRNGVQIAIYLKEEGPATLTRVGDKAQIQNHPPEKPDMSFWVPEQALDQLAGREWSSVGELGIEIIKLIASPEPTKIRAKVHIGPFDLLRNGYLGVVTLGGPAFIQFLASKGLSGIGKIKDAVNQFRG